MDINGNGNGNGGGLPMTPDRDVILRFERSLDTQEKQFQATRDDVNSLKTQQSVIQRDIGTLNTNIQSLAAKLDERGRTNWPALAIAASMSIPMIGLIGFVVTIYISSAMSPISTATMLNTENLKHMSDTIHIVESASVGSQAADANSRTDRQQLNDRLRIAETTIAGEVGERRTATAATKVALTEIETQLRAVCNIENLRAAQQERLNAMIWERANSAGGDRRYPNETFFTPCIAHDGS